MLSILELGKGMHRERKVDCRTTPSCREEEEGEIKHLDQTIKLKQTRCQSLYIFFPPPKSKRCTINENLYPKHPGRTKEKEEKTLFSFNPMEMFSFFHVFNKKFNSIQFSLKIPNYFLFIIKICLFLIDILNRIDNNQSSQILFS